MISRYETGQAEPGALYYERLLNICDLLDVDYNEVSAYGHFGKKGLPWEQ